MFWEMAQSFDFPEYCSTSTTRQEQNWLNDLQPPLYEPCNIDEYSRTSKRVRCDTKPVCF